MSTASTLAPAIQDRCIHKLPTACHLSATQKCCACADRRIHNPAYPVYIDGVGVVNQGTRWERYCWPCEEFWNNRLAASNPPLLATQTRIPDIPDQTEFLRTWYDCQRGYRLERSESGSEEKIPIRTSTRDLNPGRLLPPYDNLESDKPDSPAIPEHPSDSPLSGIDSDNFSDIPPRVRAEPTIPNQAVSLAFEEGGREAEYQTRRIALLRSELLQIRTELSRVVTGLEALGSGMESSPPQMASPTGSASAIATNTSPNQARARDLQTQVDATERRIEQIRQQRESLSVAPQRRQSMDPFNHVVNREDHLRLLRQYQDRQREFQDARRNLNHLRSESRTAQNFSNVFGTQAEVERLGEEYQSPVGNLFMNAYGAYGRAEEHRRALHQQANGSQMGVPPYPPPTPTGQPAEVWETLNGMGDPMPPGASNPQPSIFGPPADPTTTSPRFVPGGYPPASNPNFIPNAYTPYIPGTSPYGLALPPLASHYGTNYGSPPAIATPATPGAQPTNLEFNPERAFYDRVNRQYGGRETTNVPSYPRPPEFRGLREHTSPRAASYAHRLERRNRQQQDAEDYHYDLLDEMDYEESVRAHPRGGQNCVKGLDIGNDGRPEPKTDDQLKVDLACKICFSQLVDTVLLPCGHACMCQWCANQHMETSKYDKTRPIQPATCPMCRKRIKQKVVNPFPPQSQKAEVNGSLDQNTHRVTKTG